ncbi:major capsid protein [Dactylosporangium sp. NPDC000521]|uniref:major capsid protein n=1 Tax=Dactylosporangium sp. NPDC000521 TaxID=3363975 RepID=UPI0036B1EF0D
MAVTLAEAAKLSLNQLRRGVIEIFMQESRVLDQLNFVDVQGNAYAYNEELTLPGVAFRDVNTAYSESTGTINPKTEQLRMFGGDADVDRFIVQTRGNLNDQRATQTALKVKSLNFGFQDNFINGDNSVNALAFDGLKKRLTGGQVIAAGTNGIPVVGTGATDQHAFFDAIDNLISLVPGGANTLYMNNLIRGKFRSAARRVGGWQMQRDDFGRPVETYNGVRIEDIGTNASGTMIIPQTETQGASSVASSIYAVRWSAGEDDTGVLGLWNGGVMVDDLGQLQTMPVFRTRIELYSSIAVFGKGAARLTGILNS